MAAPVTSSYQKEVQYLTKDGDVLDNICWNYYGRTAGVVEKVLLRNRAVITTYQALLPAGILVVLPDITLPVAQGFKLWDYRQTEAFKAMSASIEDTQEKVQAALSAFRARTSSSGGAVTITRQPTPPGLVQIGTRTRIRATETGAVIEALGADNVWRVQQEIKGKDL